MGGGGGGGGDEREEGDRKEWVRGGDEMRRGSEVRR